ncbi:uncharacterized protein N7500_010029 [Penicillium coprophilum]|uniref:uncharacterized protein n=1 Tax=Penicillium coprophilum TaxID=36646 RepID=UPI0023A5DBE2|nr:uncharacterized protein N7500_010029 [Penicillium coprophilum]KAJ5154590.1 hypothetical protein N7500_010029 [Penicillium coprophilum]
MSSNKDSSSAFLAGEAPGNATEKTTPLCQSDASQESLPASSSEVQTESSMLEAWVQAPVSSEPWSPAKAAYSPQS